MAETVRTNAGCDHFDCIEPATVTYRRYGVANYLCCHHSSGTVAHRACPCRHHDTVMDPTR